MRDQDKTGRPNGLHYTWYTAQMDVKTGSSSTNNNSWIVVIWPVDATTNPKNKPNNRLFEGVTIFAFISVLCGTTEYDPRVHVCCGGYLVTISNTNATHCCGYYTDVQLYDTSNAVCCLGQVVPIIETNHDKCCGSSSLYNQLTQLCCGGTVISNTLACCGDVHPYDPVSQICCNGHVDVLYGSNTTECCGTQSFDNGCQECINGVVVLGYDKDTHMCCQGNILRKLYLYSCCCGPEVINASAYTCCNGYPVMKSPSDDSLCCR